MKKFPWLVNFNSILMKNNNQVMMISLFTSFKHFYSQQFDPKWSRNWQSKINARNNFNNLTCASIFDLFLPKIQIWPYYLINFNVNSGICFDSGQLQSRWIPLAQSSPLHLEYSWQYLIGQLKEELIFYNLRSNSIIFLPTRSDVKKIGGISSQ